MNHRYWKLLSIAVCLVLSTACMETEEDSLSADQSAGQVKHESRQRRRLERTVLAFYTQALTVNDQTTPSAVLGELLADDFESINSQEVKSKPVLIQQAEYLWAIIPDLKWEPQQVLVDGKRVIVRSVASGTPRGSFLGLDNDGSRSFRIDTIDIHEVKRGQIIRVHHIEDWATAAAQLSGE